MSLKQGLVYMVEQARQTGFRPQYDQKTIIIPIFSFISQLISSLKGYLNSKEYDCWYAYFLDQHLYDRSLSNMIKNWEKLKDTSLECYLLQTLLTVRNKNKLRLYLKARKQIIQTATQNAMLDEVLLDLQDAISIIHKIFPSEEIRKALVQGIKNIFMAFRISQAKLYSSVLIQYLLAVYDSIIRIESSQATISGQLSSTNNHSMYRSSNQNYQELFSSISNFQSSIHNQNGLYKKSSVGNSHTSHKKYQIIEKKFLPLKETSQYVSSATSNKFTSNRKDNQMKGEREKSLFYDFISHQTQSEEEVSREENHTRVATNSFPREVEETSFEKQKKFYRKQYNQEEPSRDKSFESKRSESKNRKSLSPQPFSQVISKFIKKQPQIQKIQTQSTKSFSLGWFSNKLFETQNEENKQSQQSFLYKAKAKLIKKAQQKRRQSTQKYEIQNHLLNANSHLSKRSKMSKYEAESDKCEEFEKMKTKNQEFKQKMLKKSQIEAVSLNEEYRNFGRNSRCKISVNVDQDKDLNAIKLKLDSDEENVIQFTSHFRTGDNNRSTAVNVKQISYSPEKDVSAESLKMMKLRNQRVLSNLGNEQKFQQSYENEESVEEESKYGVGKNQSKKNQEHSPMTQKPQIIHKSIGEKKMTHFIKYSNEQLHDDVTPQNMKDSPSEESKSSYQMGKMKSLLRIIDDYRQNTAGHETEKSQLEISESFCKKSRFYSGEGDYFGENERFKE